MSDERLLPCPFCGGEAEEIENIYSHVTVIQCRWCFCRTPMLQDPKSARKVWNTRKPMERIVERLEEAGFKFVTHGGNRMVSLEEAIDIVKGGGVDETD